ncbi:hypothetical protein BH11BAC3_BH11BAC3_17510 [soil metagenome]
MKLYVLKCFILAMICGSCNDVSKQIKEEQQTTENKFKTTHKPPGSYQDTAIVKAIAVAVFYSPDSLQLKEIKNITDQSVFESTMHEFFYQVRNAHLVIEKYYPQLKILAVKNVRYILFQRVNGERELVDLNLKNDPYGLIVFDGKKAPQLLDMTNIDTELGFYFSK